MGGRSGTHDLNVRNVHAVWAGFTFRPAREETGCPNQERIWIALPYLCLCNYAAKPADPRESSEGLSRFQRQHTSRARSGRRRRTVTPRTLWQPLQPALGRRSGASEIVTTTIEHPAVLEPCRFLERLGATVTRIPVDSTGLIDPNDVRRALRRDTVLISVMHANNEVGTIEPVATIATIARERGCRFMWTLHNRSERFPSMWNDSGSIS